jgi:hypothetical protein
MKPKKNPIEKIRKLASKKGTPLVSFSMKGKAIAFLYREGTKLRGYSYPNVDRAVPAELKRLAA